MTNCAVPRAANVLLYRLATGLGAGQSVFALHLIELGTQLVCLARRIGDIQVTIHPIAVNGKARDTGVDQCNSIQRAVPQTPSIGSPQLRHQCVLSARISHDGLSTVATRSAAADPFRLQQRHAQATVRQFDRGRQAGVAAADHHHVHTDLPLQCRPAGTALDTGLVITSLVELGIGPDQRCTPKPHVRPQVA